MQELTNNVVIYRAIVSKVLATLHQFIAQTYYELAFRDVAESIFQGHKQHVDALLAEAAGEALKKIPQHR